MPKVIKMRFLLLVPLVMLFFSCNLCDSTKEKGCAKSISEETFSVINNAYVDCDYSNGLVITFVNGDCSYCTNRIPEHRFFAEKAKLQDWNFMILIYSENNFCLKDTSSLRKSYDDLPLVFDAHNLFQIKNKLPQKPEEYSIYINENGIVEKIGTPADLYKEFDVQ